eukprot:scaffold6251_cov82-Cylindrotheca_fusiformis.AAC.3
MGSTVAPLLLLQNVKEIFLRDVCTAKRRIHPNLVVLIDGKSALRPTTARCQAERLVTRLT